MPSPAHLLVAAAIGLGGMLNTGHALALGLIEAYESAVANDPAYRAAIHENKAGQEFVAIGLSSLLPSLSANYSINQNQQDFTRESITLHRSYESQTAAVQLRQPRLDVQV